MSVRALRLSSLIYLSLPAFLFIIHWFTPLCSIAVLLCYSYALVQEFMDLPDTGKDLLLLDLLYLALVSLTLTFFSGIAGYSFQTFDHWGHNAKYYDLTVNSWPLYFPEKGVYATYYFGYYLVPAFISKVVIGQPSGAILFGWTALGLFFGLTWVFILTGRRKLLLLAMFVIGCFTASFRSLIIEHLFPQYVKSKNLYGILTLFEQSKWVPNQLIAGLIVSGLLLHNTFERRRLEASFFPITLTFIWSVFPGVFFVALYGLIWLREAFRRSFVFVFQQTLASHVVAGLAFLPVFIYLTSSNGMSLSGFIWKYEAFDRLAIRYAIFLLADVVVLYTLCLFISRNIPGSFPMWFVNMLFGLFLLASNYRIGVYNDWFMRVQIPMITMTAIIILKGVSNVLKTRSPLKPWLLTWVGVIVLLSAPVSVWQLIRSSYRNALTSAILHKQTYKPLPFDQYPNTYQFLLHKHSPQEANQYLGKKNSIYEQFLAPGS